MKRQMNLDPRIRLMYSAKANSISNGWKKWQGESKGILECNVIDKSKPRRQTSKNGSTPTATARNSTATC